MPRKQRRSHRADTVRFSDRVSSSSVRNPDKPPLVPDIDDVSLGEDVDVSTPDTTPLVPGDYLTDDAARGAERGYSRGMNAAFRRAEVGRLMMYGLVLYLLGRSHR